MKEQFNFNEVVLVNSEDQEIGTMEKLEAHEKGLLHRAFSLFLFNDRGEMLLQKRADSKYHSAGLWSNSCCSHPAKNESVEEAAKRRLIEEIFIETDVKAIFKFEYRAELNLNLVEHEMDHVLIGFCNSFKKINPMEVSAMKFVSVDDIQKDLAANPNNYSFWFKIIMTEHWGKFLPHLKLETA
uniref:Isopentenyl-diphosphate delta-isomerase n=1 Tax=uncultured Flavobacteriia bacterium TaxID=212695 RepID=H6RGD8_9BACT|nr:isopentenyl-diphosphate delta-isomerase [uncultured bacterium]CCG00099.1 isopentenyl-diphosphate delta-isomerase, type 1 [uncultured Flavobacteriia bacterium]